MCAVLKEITNLMFLTVSSMLSIREIADIACVCFACVFRQDHAMISFASQFRACFHKRFFKFPG